MYLTKPITPMGPWVGGPVGHFAGFFMGLQNSSKTDPLGRTFFDITLHTPNDLFVGGKLVN